MMQSSTQSGSLAQGPNLPSGSRFLIRVVQAFAASLEVFLHVRIGSRYLTAQPLVACLLMLGFVMVWPEEDPRPLLWFLGAFVLASALVRLRALSRRVRGQEHEHTRYNGWPRLLGVWPFKRMSEKAMKNGLEPTLTLVTGCFVLGENRPLGAYLIAASIGLMLSLRLIDLYERNRMMDMHDAYLDNVRFSERFRNSNG